MNSYLEHDFKEQQTMLVALLDDRESLQDGSQEADESDREIVATRNVILSYETLKWYER